MPASDAGSAEIRSPRVYRPSRRQWWLFGSACGLLVGLGVIATPMLLAAMPPGPVGATFALGIGLPPVVLGVWGLLSLWRARVVLHPDGIEFTRLVRGPIRLRRDQIIGRRVINATYPATHVIERVSGTPVRFSILFAPDDAFWAWLASLPDLDAQDVARAEAELLALGPTPIDAASSLRAARRLGRVLDVLTFAGCAWGFFYPQPYWLAITALSLLPVVAFLVLATGGGRYSIEGRRNDPRPLLFLPLFMPGCILVVRAVLDFTTIDRGVLVGACLAGVLGLAAALALVEPSLRQRWYSVPLMAVCLVAYPGGIAAHANVLLDQSLAETTRVEVRGKHISTGRGGGPELRLAAWGPQDAESVRVSRELYDMVDVGDVVCAELHDGALGARWFLLRSCE